jgi:hypothetical protein
LKNYTIGRKLEDSELTSADALEKVAGYVGSLVPLVSLFRHLDPFFQFADNIVDHIS